MNKGVPVFRNSSEWPVSPAPVWVGVRRASVPQGVVARPCGGPVFIVLMQFGVVYLVNRPAVVPAPDFWIVHLQATTGTRPPPTHLPLPAAMV